MRHQGSPRRRGGKLRFRKNPFAFAMLAFSSLPLAALAQESAAAPPAGTADGSESRLGAVNVSGQAVADEQDYNRGVSTVGAKTPTAVRDLPQQATVIDRAVIDAQGATSLTDVLRNVPGITLSSGEGSQIGNNINLRGFSARTDIFLDGFRDFGQYTRDIFSLDGVEVLEGPSSLLFGRGSTGGIINQVSKRPTRKGFGNVSLTLGTDSFYRVTADLDRALDSTSAFRLAVMAQDVDATRNSVITRKDYGVAPSVSFGMGTPTEITVGLLAQYNHDIADYGFPMEQFKGTSAVTPLDAPWGNYYGYNNNDFDQFVNVFSVDLRHKFSESLTLRSNTQYSRYRTTAVATPLGSLVTQDASTGNWNTVTAPTLAPPTAATLGSYNIIAQMRDRTIDDSSLFNQTDLLYKFSTGPLLHHFSTGLELGRDTYTNNYSSWYNFNYNNGAGLPGNNSFAVFNLGQSNDMAIPTGANIYRVPASVTTDTAGTLSGYFNDQVDFGTHWKLVFGLRYDQFSGSQSTLTYCYAPAASAPATCPTKANYPSGYTTLITSNSNPANTAAVQANNAAALQNPLLTNYSVQHNDYLFSTRDGLIWQPDEVQSYYFAYGTSFNPLLETVSGGLPTSAAAAAQYSAGGGYLPEKNTSYEVGGKWDLLHGDLSLSSALFQVDKTNARIQDPITLFYTLAGEERVRGAELKFVGRILPQWQVIGGWTYLNGKLLKSPTAANNGTALPNAPKNSASLWSTYTLLKHWEFGGGLTYTSNNPVTSVTGTTAISVNQVVPGYTRADATAAYLAQRWSLRLNLLNLADRDYFLTASGGRVTPADGRRALLTFSYNFL
jgi:catecholate siderophore receptor